MSQRPRYALVGVVVALLVGLFLWKYGDSTAPVDPKTQEGRQISTGWSHVEGVALAPISRELPGLRGASDGIPQHGTYVVNLWANWCGPCKVELPWLSRLDQKGEAQVVGVNRDNLLTEANKGIRRFGLTYPNVRDELGDFSESIGAVVPPEFLPSTLIVVDGRITWAHLGPFRSYHDLHDSVVKRL